MTDSVSVMRVVGIEVGRDQVRKLRVEMSARAKSWVTGTGPAMTRGATSTWPAMARGTGRAAAREAMSRGCYHG